MIDSRPETWQHIHAVQKIMNRIIKNLIDRAEKHDQSKLHSPEVECLNEHVGSLQNIKYNSEEYHNKRKLLKPAHEHHYTNNDHHPEFYPNGINDMGLISMLELFADWVASSQRHPDGNIINSIEIGQERFKYSDDIKNLLTNTVREFNALQ